MIIIKNGDLLQSDSKVIAHQVNTYGIMGSGIALQIKTKYPQVYIEYNKHCSNLTSESVLGYCLAIPENDITVINCFSQIQWRTDYDLVDEVFEQMAKMEYKQIGIPYNFGCGLAGGSWNKVFKIIQKYFLDSDKELAIYKLL